MPHNGCHGSAVPGEGCCVGAAQILVVAADSMQFLISSCKKRSTNASLHSAPLYFALVNPVLPCLAPLNVAPPYLALQHPAPIEVGALGNIGWREEDNKRQQALEEAGIANATGPLPPATPNGRAPQPTKKVRKHWT